VLEAASMARASRLRTERDRLSEEWEVETPTDQ
jgi:hypothetical protein